MDCIKMKVKLILTDDLWLFRCDREKIVSKMFVFAFFFFLFFKNV